MGAVAAAAQAPVASGRGFFALLPHSLLYDHWRKVI
eukprot:COSAG01_NODE_21365_length_905_cov_1.173697_2_plen_35_part_01